MKKKLFLCFGLSLVLFCGCGNENKKSADMTTSSVAEVLDTVEPAEETKTSLLGQITAISGDVYTIALAEQPQGMPQGEQGEIPQGMPQGGEGETPPEMPEGEQGEAPQGMPQGGEGETPPEVPEREQGEVPQGMPQGGEGQIAFNGETKDITIDDSVTITINGVSATKDELKVDDIINIEMSGETIVEIRVGFAGEMQQGTTN